MQEQQTTQVGWTLLIVGTAIIMLGIAVVILGSVLSGGSTGGGIIIFIGPIPIVIGSGPDATFLALIAAIIALAMAVMFWAVRKKTRIS